MLKDRAVGVEVNG